MIVVVLTTCHMQYTWDRSISIFLFNRTTYTAPIRYVTNTWSVVLLNKKIHILLSQVYCVWQVVKTRAIISNNPVDKKISLMSPTVAARFGTHAMECSTGPNTCHLSLRNLFSLRPPSRRLKTEMRKIKNSLFILEGCGTRSLNLRNKST